MQIDIATFESWSMTILMGGLIVWMLLIIWKMGKDSKAGKFGYFILFLALGLGFVGFVAKEVLVRVMEP